MNQYIKTDTWRIVETEYLPERTKASESLFSIGNGVMGQRANFEEQYSGETLQGSYIGGVYYPDRTRVGWWKNGYPEYFAKVLNSAFWIGIDLKVDDEQIDLADIKVKDFYRELDMQHGILRRQFSVLTELGKEVQVESVRFISLVRRELGAIRYSVTVNESAKVELSPYIDANVRNADANYNDKFWALVGADERSVQMRTLKTGFDVAWSQCCTMEGAKWKNHSLGEMVRFSTKMKVKGGEKVVLYKYAGICSSLNHDRNELIASARNVADEAAAAGFDALLAEQSKAWEEKWEKCDIRIEGDDDAQQGIRYCIFMLLQTYTGVDTRLNIGPKGFTGEKYGGSTYWDTEAYCLPFYLSTVGEDVARELLIYRYNQLDKAIENGAKLGFTNGAALYPMVTMNGEECHNEWEITFEEIHRNGAIAFAIYNFVRYTGKKEYLAEYGLEVLLSIARFWAQRTTFSQSKQRWVILGVTGPNEYENNVNNNWYTNYLAVWCMRYATEAAEWVRDNRSDDWQRIVAKRSFDFESESRAWSERCDGMYLGKDEQLGIFLQQDGYMDKEQTTVEELDPIERPINQKWSWDRILRSPFIKQADVLQGIYFFEDDFDTATIERNYRFYEARTVHESSLSPCVHSILAARIGDMVKAYRMYLRTSRLDLDDYNRENDEGLHITSMAGSWLSVVQGFGGMRVRDDKLSFSPQLPEEWNRLAFKVAFRGREVTVDIDRNGTKLSVEGEPIEVVVDGKLRTVKAD